MPGGGDAAKRCVGIRPGSEYGDRTPPIIIKKKIVHGGHHGGAWKVAYADFVTAMMALFIVLWLMNSSKQMQEAIGGYFKDPSGKSKMVGTDKTGSGDNFTLTKENMAKLKEQLQKSVRKLERLRQAEKSDRDDGDGGRIADRADWSRRLEHSLKVAAARPTIKEKKLLVLLAQELGKLPNKLSIEGHTDSKPYPGTKAYGNWELSADRANAARRLMQANGIREDQVAQVRGFADQRLRMPDGCARSVEPPDLADRAVCGKLSGGRHPRVSRGRSKGGADAESGAQPGSRSNYNSSVSSACKSGGGPASISTGDSRNEKISGGFFDRQLILFAGLQELVGANPQSSRWRDFLLSLKRKKERPGVTPSRFVAPRR